MVEAILVGCGAMSRAWLEAAREIDGLKIVGLIDIDGTRAHGRAAQFGLGEAAIGTSLDEILGRTRADAAFDLTPPSARVSVVRSALAHGLHVLTEKPMAASMDDARAIVREARAAAKLHAVVQNRRYVEAVRRIRRFLDRGAIGKPTSLHCDFFLAPHFGGFREEMDHVLLVDMAIHTFDAARAMTGLEARRVYCREWNPPNSWYWRGSSAAATFDMDEGVVFTYRGSWCADGARTSWEASWRIVGERGSLTWDGFQNLQAEALADGQRNGLFSRVRPIEVPPLDAADRVGGHLGVLQDFVAAVRSGRPPETAGEDNLKSLAMVFGAVRSAESGAPVEVEI